MNEFKIVSKEESQVDVPFSENRYIEFNHLETETSLFIHLPIESGDLLIDQADLLELESLVFKLKQKHGAQKVEIFWDESR